MGSEHRTEHRAEHRASTVPPIKEFDALHNLSFNDLALLQQAFVHRSYLNEQVGSHSELADNERLEFLGDSVLGFVVSELLYRRFPAAQEGELTHLRTVLVRRETLARLASEMEVGRFLLLGIGEEESGGRKRTATLCAAFEALVGAVFLDQGLDGVRRMLLPQVDTILAGMAPDVMPKDPKSRFQEWAQRTYSFTPRYKVVDHFGPDHAKTFVTLVTVRNEPLGVGQGPSKQDASQAAAATALHRMGEESPEYVQNAVLEVKYGLVPPQPDSAEPEEAEQVTSGQ
jgi:ribonuclease-3